MTKFSCWYQFDQTREGFSQSWLIWSLTTFHTCYNYMCRSYLPFCQWNTDYFKPNTYSPLSPRLPSRQHSCVWSPLQPGVTNVSRAGDYSGLGCVGENHQYCNMRLETLRPTTAARIIRNGNISDSQSSDWSSATEAEENREERDDDGGIVPSLMITQIGIHHTRSHRLRTSNTNKR